MNECFRCLSTDAVDWHNRLEQNSKDFAVQYAALQSFHAGTKAWVVKPKMHQFLEMCSSSSKPNMSWTYRDEDFGGCCSALQDQRWLLEKGAVVFQEDADSF